MAAMHRLSAAAGAGAERARRPGPRPAARPPARSSVAIVTRIARRAAGERGRARRARPTQPRCSSAPTTPASSPTGHPHVQPGGAVRLARRVGAGARAAPRGARRRWRPRGRPARCVAESRPQLEHEPLQDVADPARAALLAALHAGDGLRVAGEHRQAQVGPERLGDRARRRPALASAPTVVCSSLPATGPRWSSSISERVGERRRGRRAARRARRSSSAAPVGFCPRGVMIAARAPRASAARERSGSMPRSSTATGSRPRPCARRRSNSGA